MRGRALALVLALLASGVFASSAWADGDPASDILLSQDVFIPSDTGGSGQQQAALGALVQSAARAGYPLRVAVIPDAYDLGSVTALWRKPQTYAEFLGIELSLVYKGPLLIAMPNGFGVNWPGHSLASANQRLGAIGSQPGPNGLLAATDAAVRGLAASDGVKLVPSSLTSRGGAPASGGGGGAPVILVAVAAGLAAVALAGFVALRRRRRAGPRVRKPRRRPALRLGVPPPRWAVPGLAVLCCVVGAGPIFVLSRLRHSAADTSPPSASAAFTWPADQRPAPNFRLTNQAGRTVSLAAYRGRPVILTFVDPFCRNLCPLAAHVLNQVDSDLPPSQRPAIIAVSVDIYADTRADLLQDYDKWHLVPQWQWAVGSPKALASVWSGYKVGVSVTTKTIAATTVHFITHDEVAYLVDPSGHERALFVWPYTPQDVEQTLRQLSRS